MNQVIYFKKTIFLVILTVLLTVFANAQPAKTSVPRQDVLLNGLKVLVWNEPTAEKVTVKLRLHSGAMFDPKDKMGVMALLSENLFPTDQAKAFFIEDLEGSLNVTTNYDYLQITATGKTTEFLSMLETISTAVINPQITPENFKLINSARIKKVQQLEKNPSYIADMAAAKQLLGEFPYGRTAEGTRESLAKIDYADIIFAKQRFLTSDNATLVIVGNIKPDYALRVSRQLFGSWIKSDKKVPATFAMAVEPDQKNLGIDGSKLNLEYQGMEIRMATRGIARKDPDYFALRFLIDLLQNRLRDKFSKEFQTSVIHERNLLPGLLTFKVSLNIQKLLAENGSKPTDLSGMASVNVINLIKEPISPEDFNKTQTKILAEIEAKSLPDKMLDIDTFKLISVNDEMKKLNSVTIADVQRVAERISKQTFVTVSLVNNP